MGRDSTSSPTFSTSTTRLSSYFLIVLEMNFTVIFCSLWGWRVPVLGTISNSFGGPAPGVGEALSVELLSRSSVQQMLGVVPSPGTRKWNFMGTREVFWSLQVCVFKKPKTNEIRLTTHILSYSPSRRATNHGDLPYEIVPNLSFGTLNWNVGPITEPLH